MTFHILLDRVRNIGDAVALAGKLQSYEETLARYLYQVPCLRGDLSRGKGPAAVAVESALVCANVDADDIARKDFTLSRDAVNDLEMQALPGNPP